MKNFKKLIIDNFQNHKHTEIEFSDGITVFVGKTDSGKTAIFRAIKLILKNKPRGNGFISVFAEKNKKQKPTANVSLTLEDDTEIIRTKSETVNRYTVKKEDKEEIFENFGVNIPPEILDTIGANSVLIDTDTFFDINISEQLAPPFLITESPSVKTKVIDKVAKIDILNKAIKNNHTKLQNTVSNEKQVVSDIEKLEEELREFDTLNSEMERLNSLKTKISELAPLENQLMKLKELKETYSKINQSIDIGTNMVHTLSAFLQYSTVQMTDLYNKLNQLNKIVSIKDELNKITIEIDKQHMVINEKENIINSDNLSKELHLLINKYISLLTLKDNYVSVYNETTQSQKIIAENNSIPIISSKVEELKIYLNNLNILTNLKNQKDSLFNNIEIAHNFIPSQKNKIHIEQEQLRELFRQLKICPLCHSEITENQINKIV